MRQTRGVRRILVIGIGAGDPEQLTLQAVRALRDADVFFLLDKGEAKSDLSRLRHQMLDTHLPAGTYRLVFDTEAYFSTLDIAAFYPQVSVVFKTDDAPQHYHVPLLISPFGYSTYRGS